MKKLILFFITTFMLFSVVSSQETTKFGLGFEFHTKPSSETYDSNIGISFPVSAYGFMIEPEISYFNYMLTEDYEDATPSVSISYTEMRFLMGLFKTIKSEKTNLYFGIRLGGQFYTFDPISMGSSGSFTYAPTIGMEYFINKDFSFGAEGMIYKYENELPEENGVVYREEYIRLIPKFIVRFYL